MKILVLSPRLPHSRVVSGHLIVYQRILRLAQRGHQIGLATFSSPDDAERLPDIQPSLRDVRLLPAPEARPWHRLYRPSVFMPFYSGEMTRVLGEMILRDRYDVVLAEFGLMAQHLRRNPYLPAVRKVISVHQCHSLSAWLAYQMHPEWIRWLGDLRLRRLRQYEFGLYRAADHILALSPEVRYGLLEESPDLRVTVIPSGVDTEFYRPDPAARKETALIFTGIFDDVANRDAALWFGTEVWPKLAAPHPDLLFYVVGPDPSPAMKDLGRRDPRIVLTGEVEDIRPYLSRARVFVCPTRMGSGLRGKVLQAMSAGVPVVSTTHGAEGIPIQMGDTGFLADTPEIMARTVDLLLGDPVLQSGVAQRARAMVAERFSWDRGVDMLERILQETVA